MNHREVECSDRLPKDTMDKFIYMVEFDVLMVGAYDGNEWIVEGFDNPMVDRWLEPYEPPTELYKFKYGIEIGEEDEEIIMKYMEKWKP